MGAALAEAALAGGHGVTMILGPVSVAFPAGGRRIDVETAQEMYDAVMREWGGHDLLIMAAAVADYRPRVVSPVKMSRAAGAVTLELEPTQDIAAAACSARGPGQRVVGFSLERETDEGRAVEKMRRKGLDLVVFNPLKTMGAGEVGAVLLWPDGRREEVGVREKGAFGALLMERAAELF